MASSSTRRNKRKKCSIFDMNAQTIEAIQGIDDLKDVVEQLEKITNLESYDLDSMVIPLMMNTSREERGLRGAQLTERILLHCLSLLPPKMEDRINQTRLPYPTSGMYNLAILSWARLNSEAGAQRAEQIFLLMKAEKERERPYPSMSNRHPREVSALPTLWCYQSLLHAWSHSGTTYGANRALEYLDELERESGLLEFLVDPSNLGISLTSVDLPDRSTYNIVLSGYAMKHNPDPALALQKCLAICDRMENISRVTGNADYAFDGYTYRSLFFAYRNYISSDDDPSHMKKCVEDIDALLNRIKTEKRSELRASIVEHIDFSKVYGILVSVWLKTIPRMTGLQMAHKIVLGMANCPGGCSLPIRPPELWPRQRTLILLMKEWQATNLPEAGKRIDELTELAVNAPYKRNYFLNVAMAAWEFSELHHAPLVVNKMIDLGIQFENDPRELSGNSFAIAMRTWVRYGADEAPKNVEILFQKLMDLYATRMEERYKPHIKHIRILMYAWHRRCRKIGKFEGVFGNRHPADHIEAWLRRLSRETWAENLLEFLFIQAIKGWALQETCDGRLEEPDIVHRVASLLQHMQDLNIWLGPYPSNLILEICGRKSLTTEQRPQAYKLTWKVLEKGNLDSRSFELAFDAHKNLLNFADTTSIEPVMNLFRLCCSRGMLTEYIMQETIRVLPSEMLANMFGRADKDPASATRKDLPADWSCHA